VSIGQKHKNNSLISRKVVDNFFPRQSAIFMSKPRMHNQDIVPLRFVIFVLNDEKAIKIAAKNKKI
jgi:hypothetical protein